MKIFDAHFHIIDYRYPVVENNGYFPPEFTLDNYHQATSSFELVGGAVVSGSFQAFDQTYLTASLSELGEGFFGVANIPVDMSDEGLGFLYQRQVGAVRFNLKRGGSESIDHLPYLSDKLYEKYGWHTELYLDSKQLVDLAPTLRKIKRFSIDHLGLSSAGLKELYHWVEQGVKVKATGFGRIDFDPIPVMQQIHRINPTALMFGTDLPSTRAKIPFSMVDVQRVTAHFDQAAQEQIFYRNALSWYGKSHKE